MNPNLVSLAFELADDFARSEIEQWCAEVGTEPEPRIERKRHWYDTTDVVDYVPREDIDRALLYLQMRGHLITHPVNSAFVTFAPVDRAAKEIAA